MADINLLQNNSTEIGSEVDGFARIIAKVLVLVLGLVVVGYGVLFFLNMTMSKSLISVNQEVQSKQVASMTKPGRNEVITRQEQLSNLETLTKGHVFWSYLLPELARVTLHSAKYTSIEAKSDGKLNLSVILPSYAEVEKYIQIFDLPEYNQQFSNVRIVSINKKQTENAITYQLTIQLTFNTEYIKGRS